VPVAEGADLRRVPAVIRRWLRLIVGYAMQKRPDSERNSSIPGGGLS
jgi:hypothetical protein